MSSKFSTMSSKLSIADMEADYDSQELAISLFDSWDPDGKGAVSLDEILKHTKLDQKLILFLLGKISDDSGTITVDGLQKFIEILLKDGKFSDKLQLLLQIIDPDNTGVVELEENLQKDILKNILLRGNDKDDVNTLDDLKGFARSSTTHINEVKVEELKCIFETNEEAPKALDFYCGRLLEVLVNSIENPLSRPIPVRWGRNRSQKISKRESIKLKSFNYHISKPTQFILLLSLLQVGLFLWIFLKIYIYESGHASFAIAHGFGINIRIITLFQYATMARTTMAFLHGYKFIRPLVPLGFNIELHSYLGFCLLLNSYGHLFGHIAFAEEVVPTGFLYRFVQPCLILGTTWDDVVYGDGITGFILLSLITIFTVAALYRGYSSMAYLFFIFTHNFHLIWPIFLLLHVPYDMPYAVFVLCIFIGERLYDLSFLTVFSTLAASRPGSDGIAYISVNQVQHSTPGCYYRIKVPALSLWEWHPFSLASGTSSERLTFFCASVGDWTNGLYKLVSSPDRQKYTILIQGPFLAPASFAMKETVILAVATGVGITPFLSMIATHVSSQQVELFDENVFEDMFKDKLSNLAYESTDLLGAIQLKLHSATDFITQSSSILEQDIINTRNIPTITTTTAKQRTLLRVIWSIREVKDLLFYFDYIRNLLKLQDTMERHRVEVDVYLTGIGNSSNPNDMLSQTLFLLSLTGRNQRFMRIHFGRLDVNKVFIEIKPKECYYCGGNMFKNILSKICFEKNVPFHGENFDAGGTFIKNCSQLLTTLKKGKFGATTRKQKRRSSVGNQAPPRRLTVQESKKQLSNSPQKPIQINSNNIV